jgi:L-ascorbate metabolism protein UlaG (beta-lactamase superfamily)
MTRPAQAAERLGRRRLLAGAGGCFGAVMLEWLSLSGSFDHRVLPLAAAQLDASATRDRARATLVHIGHATHLLELDGTRVLTDPWFFDPGHGGMWHARGPALAPERVGPLELVLITHEHPDHADAAALDRLDKRALVVAATRELAQKARALGFERVETLCAWDSLEHAGVRVSAVPAVHDVYEVGYMIERGGTRVYFAGDTALHRDLPAIAERFAPNVALLPVDGTRVRGAPRLVMDPADAVRALRILRAQLVVPSHADASFIDPVLSWYATQVEGAAQKFARALGLAMPEARCALPAIGERVLLPA